MAGLQNIWSRIYLTQTGDKTDWPGGHSGIMILYSVMSIINNPQGLFDKTWKFQVLYVR